MRLGAQQANTVVELVRHQHTAVGQVQYPGDLAEHCLGGRAVLNCNRAHGDELFHRGHGASNPKEMNRGWSSPDTHASRGAGQHPGGVPIDADHSVPQIVDETEKARFAVLQLALEQDLGAVGL